MAWVREKGHTYWVPHEKTAWVGALSGAGSYRWNCPLEKDCPSRVAIHGFYYCWAKPRQLVKNARSGELFSCEHWGRASWKCNLGIKIPLPEPPSDESLLLSLTSPHPETLNTQNTEHTRGEIKE